MVSQNQFFILHELVSFVNRSKSTELTTLHNGFEQFPHDPSHPHGTTVMCTGARRANDYTTYEGQRQSESVPILRRNVPLRGRAGTNSIRWQMVPIPHVRPVIRACAQVRARGA